MKLVKDSITIEELKEMSEKMFHNVHNPEIRKKIIKVANKLVIK